MKIRNFIRVSVAFMLSVVLLFVAGCTAKVTNELDGGDYNNEQDNSDNNAVGNLYDYDITDVRSLAAHDHIMLTVEDDLQEALGGEYYVDYVDSVYISQEYIDELTYNSLTNVYFGYDYDSIVEAMSGVNWTFTVNEEGKTVVTEVHESSNALVDIVKKVAIGTGVIVVCAVVSAISGGLGAAPVACFFAGAANTALISAVSGAAVSGVIGGAIEGIRTQSWEGALNGAMSAAADGYMWGAISGAILGGFTSSYCFTGDTLVRTSDGYEQIEDIQTGDLVYSYDELNGEYAYQRVSAVHQTTTTELVNLTVYGEQISATPTHPFYTTRGWIDAGELSEDDCLLTEDGYVKISSVEYFHSSEEITTWNLSVENAHTFTVTSVDVVVHNKCGDSTKLRNAMKANDMDPPDFPNAAHHIVPSSDARFIDAVEARNKYFSIVDDINDFNNGVFLPTKKGVGVGTYHRTLHTAEYYEKVNNLLDSVTTKEGLYQVLNYIREGLLAGTFV